MRLRQLCECQPGAAKISAVHNPGLILLVATALREWYALMPGKVLTSRFSACWLASIAASNSLNFSSSQTLYCVFSLKACAQGTDLWGYNAVVRRVSFEKGCVLPLSSGDSVEQSFVCLSKVEDTSSAQPRGNHKTDVSTVLAK